MDGITSNPDDFSLHNGPSSQSAATGSDPKAANLQRIIVLFMPSLKRFFRYCIIFAEYISGHYPYSIGVSMISSGAEVYAPRTHPCFYPISWDSSEF
jgi:hypothetical protein